MPFVSINQLQPGMILSADVTDTNGRLLLSKGKAIATNHMTVFKMWGFRRCRFSKAMERRSMRKTHSIPV